MTAPANLRFDKWEGLGNDFILITTPSESGFDTARIRALCDRRFGVGADGVLLVLPPREGGDARMKVMNADGSVPSMCGNGLRCVALLVAERRGLTAGRLGIETDAGLRECRFERSGDSGDVDADMGVVRVLGPKALDVSGRVIELTLADVGNPHAISYCANPNEDLNAVGLLLATHPAFEQGTNVEFVRWRDDVLEVSVWERGVGKTLACGTGACAVAAVACARGEAKSGAPVRVRLPGGDLRVTHDSRTGATRMLGPARRVFRGEQ